MKTITHLLGLLLSSISFAQVGIGTTTPDVSAALDVESASKGLLPPRMTEAERDAIITPATGLIVWCTNCGIDGEVQVFNGTTWTNIIGGAAAEGPPQVGDFHDGGVVFYVVPSPTDLNGDGSLDTGLVCALVDQSSAIKWSNSTSTTGASATAIGTGAANTSTIISSQESGTYAASICGNYSITVDGIIYNDWFLPSKDELNLMYQNKATIDVTATSNGGNGFSSAYYWSSTEANTTNAWLQTFGYGYQNNYFKSNTKRVRAVRAF